MSPADQGTDPATILLVEDHDDTREMYRVALAAASYRLATLRSPAEALQRVATVKPALIIMDIGLAGEGFAVAERLAKLPKAPLLIAVTGRARSGIPAEDLFVEYMVKPVMPDALLDVVWRVLRT